VESLIILGLKKEAGHSTRGKSWTRTRDSDPLNASSPLVSLPGVRCGSGTSSCSTGIFPWPSNIPRSEFLRPQPSGSRFEVQIKISILFSSPVRVVPVPGKPYGHLRTVWSQGLNSTPVGLRRVPMNLNDPGAPVPNYGFVDSSLGAGFGLAIDGKQRAHLVASAAFRDYESFTTSGTQNAEYRLAGCRGDAIGLSP
jgi:hypothetical protein